MIKNISDFTTMVENDYVILKAEKEAAKKEAAEKEAADEESGSVDESIMESVLFLMERLLKI